MSKRTLSRTSRARKTWCCTGSPTTRTSPPGSVRGCRRRPAGRAAPAPAYGLRRRDPITGLCDHPEVVRFYRLVVGTPALSAALVRYHARGEDALADALSEAVPDGRTAPTTRLGRRPDPGRPAHPGAREPVADCRGRRRRRRRPRGVRRGRRGVRAARRRVGALPAARQVGRARRPAAFPAAISPASSTAWRRTPSSASALTA